MFESIAHTLGMAEHHRGAGVQAQSVSTSHHRQPLVGRRLTQANAVPNVRRENLAPAAGHTRQARRHQAAHDLFQLAIKRLRGEFAGPAGARRGKPVKVKHRHKFDKLGRAEGVQVNLGERCLQVTEHLLVKRER